MVTFRSLAMILVGSACLAQGRGVTITVRDQLSGLPLRNAEVIDRSTGRSVMSDDSGTVHVDVSPTEPMRIRVRQVGYHFVDTVLIAGNARLAVPLSRVAYALPTVPVTRSKECDVSADSTSALLAAGALDQLRMSAERYEGFRHQYPFRVTVERRTRQFSPPGNPKRDVVRNESVTSDDWGERYSPGHVLSRDWRGFSVPILFIANLADTVFWQKHCFAVLGIETLNGSRMVRLEFRPTRELRDPDWEGFALLDSATSELRRVEFRLTNIGKRDLPRRLEGYTTFRSPSPFIVVPESTAAIWWRRDAEPGDRFPDILQVLHVKELAYRRASPP